MNYISQFSEASATRGESESFKNSKAKKTRKIKYFKNGQKSIFEVSKSVKLPRMQFHEKIFLIFSMKIVKNDFTNFFFCTFLRILEHTVVTV